MGVKIAKEVPGYSGSTTTTPGRGYRCKEVSGHGQASASASRTQATRNPLHPPVDNQSFDIPEVSGHGHGQGSGSASGAIRRFRTDQLIFIRKYQQPSRHALLVQYIECPNASSPSCDQRGSAGVRTYRATGEWRCTDVHLCFLGPVSVIAGTPVQPRRVASIISVSYSKYDLLRSRQSRVPSLYSRSYRGSKHSQQSG
jgi:hypothetical protein